MVVVVLEAVFEVALLDKAVALNLLPRSEEESRRESEDVEAKDRSFMASIPGVAADSWELPTRR